MKRLLHILLYSCLKATELIDKRSVARLTWLETIRLHFHKSLCDACTSYEKQGRLMDEILHEHFHTHAAEEPSAHRQQQEALKERIINRLS